MHNEDRFCLANRVVEESLSWSGIHYLNWNMFLFYSDIFTISVLRINPIGLVVYYVGN